MDREVQSSYALGSYGNQSISLFFTIIGALAEMSMRILYIFIPCGSLVAMLCTGAHMLAFRFPKCSLRVENAATDGDLLPLNLAERSHLLPRVRKNPRLYRRSGSASRLNRALRSSIGTYESGAVFVERPAGGFPRSHKCPGVKARDRETTSM